MTCNICKIQEASVFLTQIVEGKMKKKAFCEECSKIKEVKEATLFGFPELLLEFTKMQDQALEEKTEKLFCEHCGFSQENLKKTGRLGCSRCYSVFKDDLTILLLKMQGSLSHQGKVPLKIATITAKKRKIEQIEAHLNKVVKAEKYEEAALLRDELHQLKDLDSRKKRTAPMVQKMLFPDDA